MTFSENMRLEDIITRYVTQKIIEAIFSSAILSISYCLILKYSHNPEYYGLYHSPTPFSAVVASFAFVIVFNIFTLYPVVMFIPLVLSLRIFNTGRVSTASVSAISSLSYAVAWSFCIGFYVTWVMWIVFIFTALFVFWSSFLLYSTPQAHGRDSTASSSGV